MNKVNDIEDLLQEYFNQSDHYLAPAKLEHINTIIDSDGLSYMVKIEDVCDATGYEIIYINQNDLLVWIYNHE